MAVRLGDTAPDFTAQTTEGPVNFHEWLGDSWGVLFSHPKDYTPVCTTELGYTAKLKPEFEKRDVKVIGLSVDPLDSHKGWAKDIEETQGVALNFPVIADSDRKVSDLYDMIHPNANDTLTVRSVYVIGPDKKVKLTITYPASTGRNSVRQPERQVQNRGKSDPEEIGCHQPGRERGEAAKGSDGKSNRSEQQQDLDLAEDDGMQAEEQHRPEKIQRQLQRIEPERLANANRIGQSLQPDAPGGNRHHDVERRPYRREDLVGRGKAGLGDARIPCGDGLGG